MNHLMIDLETMGNTPNAPIVAIGAVFFCPTTGELGSEFYAAVDLVSDMNAGAVVDGSTVLWWLKQSSEARAAITVDDALPIKKALLELGAFAVTHSADGGTTSDELKLWGNGATFDNIILSAAFKRCGIRPFWGWYNDRDVRTIVELGRAIGFDPKHDMPFDGVQHSALADAKHQAKYVSAIWQRLVPPAATDINM